MSFDSPNYNNQVPKYPNTMFCQWTFTAPAGMAIMVEFTTFDLDPYSDDYVYVGTETGVGSNARMFSYTGSSLPATWTSSGNIVTISMDTDDEREGNYQGFQVTLTAVDPACKCHCDQFDC